MHLCTKKNNPDKSIDFIRTLYPNEIFSIEKKKNYLPRFAIYNDSIESKTLSNFLEEAIFFIDFHPHEWLK